MPHVVLNAKFHEREAEIVAQAGRRDAVTIATNMAGRGTDILLGGNPEGLAEHRRTETESGEQFATLLGELRRTRARSARRCSPPAACTSWAPSGTSRGASTTSSAAAPAAREIPAPRASILSLEDDLMRIFGSDRIQGLMRKLGMEEGEPIEHGMVSRAIERAQKQVEGRNFETRKHLLEYDDVMNKQREEIYKLRRDILEGRAGQGRRPRARRG